MAVPLLAACQHQDATDTVTGWWHNFEGGEIARLHAPPPGANDRYPHIGRTPTTAPELPTPEARLALTTRLESQRNLAQRESAALGALPTIPPPPKQPAATSASTEQSGMTVTAVGQPDAEATAPAAIVPTGADTPPETTGPQPAPKPAGKKPGPAPTPPPAPAPAPPAPEAALPEVVAKSIPPTPPGQFPQIGALPPPPPSFPGFDLPSDANAAGPVQPDIDASTPEGTLIRFQPATDHVVGNPQGAFQHIVSQRGNQHVTIRGFGAAMSAEAALAPTDQEHEIALGLLRARAVARALIERGVPASAISLRAEAIGDGVRVVIGG